MSEERSQRFRLALAARPAQALLETWLVGVGLLYCLYFLSGGVPQSVLVNGLLFLCGVCGLWTVLRVHLPEGSVGRQILWEGVVGLALSLVMAAGLRLPVIVLGWEQELLQASPVGSFGMLLLPATGVGYWIARVGVRLLVRWNHMRRERMVWAVTHTQLTIVVLVIVLGAVLLTGVALVSNTGLPDPQSSSSLAALAELLLHTLFPAAILFSIMVVAALVVLLPPSILLSYLVARRTTRRLEELAITAGSLRQGDYEARVEVTGQDEVAQLQSDFNAMADELEDTLRDLQGQRDKVSSLLETRRELVATVSHELRTPVATARATLESALDRPQETVPRDLRREMGVVKGEITRLQGLIDDLFSLSHAEAGGLSMDLQPTAIAPLIRDRVAALAPLAWKSSQVEVSADVPEDLPPALSDRRRLEQSLSNLLRNAVQHTMPGGIVAVVARASTGLAPDGRGGGSIRIEVRDTGEGIPPQDLPHIWDPFYQGSQAKAKGAGLGLALVKELTEAMGGGVAVESIVGQGSTFVVTLPLAGQGTD